MYKHNPYKKTYNTSNSNTMYTTKYIPYDNLDNLDYLDKSYLSQTMFNCKKCKLVFTTKHNLDIHSQLHIHVKPISCQFPKCGKIFSFRKSYQYKQHIDSHNGGLNIKCKFCDHRSRSLLSNTLHMKTQHTEEYTLYINKIDEYNDDIKKIDMTNITNLTNTAFETNNLHLFADIALSYC